MNLSADSDEKLLIRRVRSDDEDTSDDKSGSEESDDEDQFSDEDFD
jgi:hypothetical protein